jgi:hypothetical protein
MAPYRPATAVAAVPCRQAGRRARRQQAFSNKSWQAGIYLPELQHRRLEQECKTQMQHVNATPGIANLDVVVEHTVAVAVTLQQRRRVLDVKVFKLQCSS